MAATMVIIDRLVNDVYIWYTMIKPPSATLRTRERIVKAAQLLMATRGSEACTTRAVAAAAHVTAGAIYRHFASRDDLIAYVVGLAVQRFELHLFEAIVSLPVGSFARIGALGNAYLQFAHEHEQEFRVLFLPVGRRRRQQGDVFGKAAYPILRRCIAEAMESGQIRNADPDVVALYVWTRVHGIVTLFMACDVAAVTGMSGDIDALSFFTGTRELVLAGLRSPDPPRA
jgi:AcrR family transcriptional regulator